MCVNYYSYLTTNQADSQPGCGTKKTDSIQATQHYQESKIMLLKTISLNYLNNII